MARGQVRSRARRRYDDRALGGPATSLSAAQRRALEKKMEALVANVQASCTADGRPLPEVDTPELYRLVLVHCSALVTELVSLAGAAGDPAAAHRVLALMVPLMEQVLRCRALLDEWLQRVLGDVVADRSLVLLLLDTVDRATECEPWRSAPAPEAC